METMEGKSLSNYAWNRTDISPSSSAVTILTELPRLHYTVTGKEVRCLPKFYEKAKIENVINFDAIEVFGLGCPVSSRRKRYLAVVVVVVVVAVVGGGGGR